ncbi:SagB/ThcOx family dehydrogenase [Myxacorys almedinensis]|uniref:SagB/ThcOx family dehydrogenase n=1 Tax=Myxacorys almedinensis A TaxID=2690445 RepID=A0A8J7Z5Y3_9CYAN|nr:SagB/ThcOx family dehydrogenase [Myxacorys almedinensis]NDJ16080.1 SagB/ThcOx family dehydrogenase [Myxacorys almedinensis A]
MSIAQHYHERTKYDPATIHAKSHALNWEEQPIPFKDYQLGVSFDLKPALENTSEPGSWWKRLSKLLYCTYGLTGMIPTAGEPHYLRSSPSAGALYPAELYLISRGTPRLPAGLYHYQAKTHSLIHFWESDVWASLQSACFWNPVLEGTQMALVATAVFFRSVWRYQDRAYRRIFLDTGHLLGNLELACGANDYRPHLIGGFADKAVNQLLYLDGEQEGAIAVIPLADRLDINENLSLTRTALPAALQVDYPPLEDGQLLNYLHQATQIQWDTTTHVDWSRPNDGIEGAAFTGALAAHQADKYNFPFCHKVPTIVSPVDWGTDLDGLEQSMINRRSTRAYTGEPLTLDDLKALLDFTYQPQSYIGQDLDGSPDYFDVDLVETFVAISNVTGLDEGCYYYAPKAQELRQIRFKNFRSQLHYLCLGQDLGRDAAAVIFHTADLEKAVGKYGDRAYRYLHMDAGHLGQRLNLAAVYLDLGVSGIGGFFDDQVNEVLGIPADEAVLYITTLGRARKP